MGNEKPPDKRAVFLLLTWSAMPTDFQIAERHIMLAQNIFDSVDNFHIRRFAVKTYVGPHTVYFGDTLKTVFIQPRSSTSTLFESMSILRRFDFGVY